MMILRTAHSNCIVPQFFYYNFQFAILIIIMFKKKDLLHESLKKNIERVFAYLDASSLVNLALCSKKYYLLVQPTLIASSSDFMARNKTKNNNKEARKTKAKNRDESSKTGQNEIEVDVARVPINKAKQKLKNGIWTRIYSLPFSNSYLQGKLESGAIFFYQNSESGQITFINRSLVDPNLNYNYGGFNEDMEDQMKTNMYAQMFEGDLSDLDLTSPEALRNRHKQMLAKIEKKKEEIANLDVINYEQEFMNGVNCKKIAIILCFGGSFSFGIFEDGKCTLHKSDKKYVCRKKAGERQLNRDKQSGSQIYSMGSQIRRDQEKKHIANVGQILTQNKEAIDSCDLVFLQAPGLNRLFIINDSETLSGVKDKLRSVCLTAKKANYTEVQAIYNEITKLSLVSKKEEAKKELKS